MVEGKRGAEGVGAEVVEGRERETREKTKEERFP